MKTLSKILLVVSIAGFVVGLSDVGNSMFSGLARAIGAVFFILTFITRAFEIAEGEGDDGKAKALASSESSAKVDDLARHGQRAA